MTMHRPWRWLGTSMLFIVLAAASIFSGCRKQESTNHYPISVILLSIDTLRADALGCYGNPGARTPNIDGLAKSGILFENAMSQAPATGPSFASIMTSKYPIEHGVIHSTRILGEDHLTMAEIFKSHGYRTGSFISCSILRSQYGFAQGFDNYDEEFTHHYFKKYMERDASHVTEAAISWLLAGRGEPFFMWLHYFDPHAPYKKRTAVDLNEQFGEIDFLKTLWRRRSDEDIEKVLPTIRKLYSEEVSYVDQHVGKLLETIWHLNLVDRTLIIIVSDHGEELFEHDQFYGHFLSLYDNVLRVPLIFVFPPFIHAGKRITEVVETIDILSTTLSICKIPQKTGFSGYDLLPTMKNGSPVSKRLAYSMREPYDWMRGGMAFAARTKQWKFIFFMKDKDKLFNLASDPTEKRNLIDKYPDLAVSLKRNLQKWFARSGHPQGVNLHGLKPEDLEILRNLGYIE